MPRHTSRTPRRPFEPAHRRCNRCECVKPITEFYPRHGYTPRKRVSTKGRKGQGLSSRQPICIACAIERNELPMMLKRLRKKTLQELAAIKRALKTKLRAVKQVEREKASVTHR